MLDQLLICSLGHGGMFKFRNVSCRLFPASSHLSLETLCSTFSYSISDVVQTLLDYCLDNNSDPTRTYAWICILCINQHRVVECSKSGILDSEMLDFESKFRSRVLQIGHVLVMMGPWQEPLYLKRIWCIFEFFTATANDIPISIIMPHREANRMTHELIGREGRGVDALYIALQSIDIQQACASVEEDKVRILRLVEESVGFNNVNRSVGEHFRYWVKGILERIVAAHLGKDHDNFEDQFSLSSVWDRMGKLFTNIGDHKLALKCYEKALDIRKACLGINHLETAAIFDSIGSAYFSRGYSKKAHDMYSKCLSVRESRLGSDHPLTALSYRSIGWALASRGENDEALAMFRKCQVIQEANPGTDPQSTAETYTDISALLQRKGLHRQAISMQQRAVTIIVTVSGTNHPRTASAYISLGNIFAGAGSDYYDEALTFYRKSFDIRDITLGRSHPETAVSLYSIGLVLKLKQDYSEALPWFRRCQELQEKYLDLFHPHRALTYNALATILTSLDQLDEALMLHTKAELIQRISLGKNHPSTIKTRKLKEQTALNRNISRRSWTDACCHYMDLPLKVTTVGIMMMMATHSRVPKFIQVIFLVVFCFLIGICSLFIIGHLVIRLYGRVNFFYQHPDTIMTLPMADQDYPTLEMDAFPSAVKFQPPVDSIEFDAIV